MFETFYKLRADPFRLTPDSNFCFRHPSYNQAYAYLKYALRLGEGFIMVTGRSGVGKTTLAEVFLTEIEHSEVVAARVASANVEAADLLRLVAYAYGIDVAGLDKATVLLRLKQFFVRQTQSGRRVLLIIDEAQALPRTALEEGRLLADMQMDSRPLLQLFLVGQEKLRSLMREPDMEQFQQRVIGACHLQPMDLLATHAYIEHRLRTAGWTGDPQLTGAAVLALYQYTQGVPRHVNKLCTRLLLHGMLNEKHELHKADVLTVAADLRAEQLAPVDGDETRAADAQETKALPQQLSLADLVLRMDPQEAEQLRAVYPPGEPERSGAPHRLDQSRDLRDSEQDATDNTGGAARQRSALRSTRVTARSGIGRQRADPGKWGLGTLVRHRSLAISGQYLRERAQMFSRLSWQGKLAPFVAALLVANLVAAIVLTQPEDSTEGIAVSKAPGEQATEPARTIITTDTDTTAKTPTPAPVTRATKQKAESLAKSIERIVNSETVVIEQTEPATKETDAITNNVEGFYDDNTVRMEESDSESNRHITISNSPEDIGKLSKNDSDYINALNELKRGNTAHVPFSTTSQITAKNQPAKARASEERVDYFNKVDVSSKKAPPVEATLTIAQQIEKALSDEDNVSNSTTNTSEEAHTDAYLATLETASVERKNEMRTIKVKRGDTLWEIARRAYGSGFQYPKIYKANPHLTSPDKIQVGDVLRVPL